MDQEQSFMFNPIKSSSLVNQVVTIISDLIKEKKLNPGDKIMNEYDLAKNLQVSRSSIREAIKILVAFGVVEIKIGSGTYISRGSGVSSLEVLGYCLMLDKDSHNLIFELRAMLEIGLMYILIDNITTEDLVLLEELVKKQEKVRDQEPFNYEEYTKLDIEFHLKLASLSKNSLVEKVYGTMLDVFSGSIKRSVLHQKGNETSIEIHKNFIEILSQKKKEKISEAVFKSLEIWKLAI